MPSPVPSAPPDRAWQRMLSGRRLDLLDPSPLDIEITDIALGLSRVARWNGQTTGEHGFSVAQHCLLVLDLLVANHPRANHHERLCALLHDASEYVTSDLITPFKSAIGAPYKVIEKRIERAVLLRFGLPGDIPDDWHRRIKQADGIAAYLEAVQLAGFNATDARKVLGFRGRAPALSLIPWPAEQARQAYLTRFFALYGEGQVTAGPDGSSF